MNDNGSYVTNFTHGKSKGGGTMNLGTTLDVLGLTDDGNKVLKTIQKFYDQNVDEEVIDIEWVVTHSGCSKAQVMHVLFGLVSLDLLNRNIALLCADCNNVIEVDEDTKVYRRMKEVGQLPVCGCNPNGQGYSKFGFMFYIPKSTRKQKNNCV